MKPKSYQNQDGCHNCGFAFVKYDWEEADHYYCTHGDVSLRPVPCGSVRMKEPFWGKDKCETQAYQDMETWDKWKEKRWVYPWGTCPHFKKAKKGAL